jgi:hypothetical protein
MPRRRIGMPFPRLPNAALVWERLHYDWVRARIGKGLVTDSNIFKSGGTWEIRGDAGQRRQSGIGHTPQSSAIARLPQLI